jgi:O-methyltransferase
MCVSIANKIRDGLGNFIFNLMDRQNLVVISLRDAERSKIVNLIRQCKKETKMLLGTNEAYQIVMAVKNTSKINGDIAEVGVYKGGSAFLICKVKGDKFLHLFDTFEGLPKTEEIDDSFYKGEYAASLEEVKHSLRECLNVYFYKGLFPTTAVPVKDKSFSFVHLDVDIYESTQECLKFFYPRLSRGGIIISHDYFFGKGVRKAFDEFFQDKPEPIIPISGSQCLIVKV